MIEFFCGSDYSIVFSHLQIRSNIIEYSHPQIWRQPMEMKLTPRFYQDGERIFGPGVAELMEQVQVHRSLRSAAQAMEMAYSKAWR